MPILYGAVAYREDLIAQYENEINSWQLTQAYQYPIASPKGAVCDKTYILIAEINASEETIKEWIDIVLKAMQRECPDHNPRIRINDPQPATHN